MDYEISAALYRRYFVIIGVAGALEKWYQQCIVLFWCELLILWCTYLSSYTNKLGQEFK